MMQVTVTDHESVDTLFLEGCVYDEVEFKHLEIHTFEAIVSIVDSPHPCAVPPPGGWEVWAGLGVPKIRLEFDDVVQDNPYLYRFRATDADIQSIIDFARQVPDKHVLLHCAAGVSRSTAAALIMLATTMSPEQAWVQLRSSKRVMRPNVHMVAVADRLLGLKGALSAVLEWDVSVSDISHVKEFVLQRLDKMLAQPDGWGPPHAVEDLILTLVEMLHVINGAPEDHILGVSCRFGGFINNRHPGPPIALASRLGLEDEATEEFIETMTLFVQSEQSLVSL